MFNTAHRGLSKKINTTAIVFAACLAALLCAATVSAGDDFAASGTPAQIAQLNARMEKIFSDIPRPDMKVNSLLVDKVNAGRRIPVIVRLREGDLPYGFFADKTRSRSRVINSLQDTVVNDVSALTSGDKAALHVKRFRMIPAMGLQVNASELEALLANPNVIDVVEDVPAHPTLAQSVPLIGAGPDGDFSTYTGLGQTVAILDTGVDKTHPFLANKVVSEACYSSNYDDSTSLCPGGVEELEALNSGLNCDMSVDDVCAHGTHVAGIAAGKGDSFSGVARDASIIAIQVFSLIDDVAFCGTSNPCVGSYSSDQISGLERVYELRNDYNIASANMSLGGGKYEDYCDDENPNLKPVIDQLRAAGIATVIASGNEEYVDGIGRPACISTAVSVGSTDDSTGSGLVTDEVSSFSNSADFLSLLAPGIWITSSVPGLGSATWGGTSMAAPHVAGAWAVLKQAVPDASVDTVLSALQTSGVPITDTRIGAGNRVTPRIDVQAALEALDIFRECQDGSDCGILELCEDSICVRGPDSSYWITVTLKGPGTVDVAFEADMQNIAGIELTGTSEYSSVSIKSKLKKTPVYLGEIDIDGSLKGIKGKGVYLTGALTATGGIAKMQIEGTMAGSSIEAEWIDKLSIKGDFSGDVELTGEQTSSKGYTLGKASIKGELADSQWHVSGDVGAFQVGTWGAGSTLAVGVDPGADQKFFTGDDIATGGSLGKYKYKYYDTNNGGEKFGIIADDFTKIKITLPLEENDFTIEQL